MIRALRPADVADIATIHADSLPGDLLALLGARFLGRLYLAMIGSGLAFGFVAELNERVDGFVIGTTQTSGMFRSVLRAAAPGLLIAALPRLLSRPTLAWKIAQAFVYPSRVPGVAEEAELLVIAVRSERRGERVGVALVEALNREFVGRRIASYKLTVYEANERAARFYERLQFDRRGSFTLFGRPWRLYTYDLRRSR